MSGSNVYKDVGKTPLPCCDNGIKVATACVWTAQFPLIKKPKQPLLLNALIILKILRKLQSASTIAFDCFAIQHEIITYCEESLPLSKQPSLHCTLVV